MKSKMILGWVMAFCICLLAGCGREEEEQKGTESVSEIEAAPTGEYIPVADFTVLSIPWASVMGDGDCLYRGDELFYLKRVWIAAADGEEYGHYESSLLAVADDGTDLPRVVAESSDDGAYISLFFVDKRENLYLYETRREHLSERTIKHYYLRKIDVSGQEVFRVDLTEVMDEQRGEAVEGYVDEDGNIALIDYMMQQVYFLDSSGQYRSRAEGMDHVCDRHFITNNIVQAGDQVYYLWGVDSSANSLVLQEVDFQNGIVKEKKVIGMSSMGSVRSDFDCVLFDGGDLGLLISTKDVLWQYHLETGEAKELFRWDEEHVGVDGRYVAQINWGAVGDGGISMDILCYDDFDMLQYTDPMAVHITYMDKAYVTKRDTISIGINSNKGDFEKTVRRFNRLNKEYQAVLTEYDAGDLKTLLMTEKDVPDLLDITGIRTEWLETKALLEDLKPYFDKSGNICKEDILPAVWRLLEKEGKLTSMATGFTIRSMITATDVPEDGWDYDRFFGMASRYPESWYFRKYDAAQVWGTISVTALDGFIDWKKHKCSFQSKEFQSLLEEISALNYPKRQGIGNGKAEEEMEKLLTLQVLFQYVDYGSPFDYNEEQTNSNERIKSVGFPTPEGEPAFLFQPSQNLAIYAKSANKDGAWAFMEFLLSEEEQDWYGSKKDVFPVREDAFEAYLERSHHSINVSTGVTAFEDTPDRLRYMAEHLEVNQNNDDLNIILLEELQAYFAGDKTVQETAKTIQNRVKLYLNEM